MAEGREQYYRDDWILNEKSGELCLQRNGERCLLWGVEHRLILGTYACGRTEDDTYDEGSTQIYDGDAWDALVEQKTISLWRVTPGLMLLCIPFRHRCILAAFLSMR